jgi:hypothetical protein
MSFPFVPTSSTSAHPSGNCFNVHWHLIREGSFIIDKNLPISITKLCGLGIAFAAAALPGSQHSCTIKLRSFGLFVSITQWWLTADASVSAATLLSFELLATHPLTVVGLSAVALSLAASLAQ